MKNKGMMILAIVMILTTVLAFSGCSAASGTSTGTSSDGHVVIDLGENMAVKNKITVSAQGSIKVAPDVAFVTVGVVTQDQDIQKAQSDNKDLMNSLYTAMKDAGLSEDDMQTTNYSIYPIYDYNSNGKISAYEVNNLVELTIRDIDNVGNYIDIAAQAGANTSYAIVFDLQDESEYYNEALTDALAAAKGKADAIAKAGDYQIIGTIEVSENSTSNDPYRDYAMAETAAADGGSSTPISAGKMEVTASVTIVYEIA